MPEAQNASTLILMRDGDAGLEVLMVKRHIKSDFVGGAYVFPGGVVEPADVSAFGVCAGVDDQQASELLGVPCEGLAYWVAAIRECFEETGILLARRNGCFPDYRDASSSALCTSLRRALRNHRSFPELLARKELRLATDALQYFAHWITPEGQRRRYDTRFFLAVAPPGQAAMHDGSEVTAACWVSPAEAIAKAENREWTVVFPTMRNLMVLRDYGTIEAALSAVRAGRVRTIQPRVVKDGSGVRFLLPEDDGYDQAGPSAFATTADMVEAALKKTH